MDKKFLVGRPRRDYYKGWQGTVKAGKEKTIHFNINVFHHQPENEHIIRHLHEIIEQLATQGEIMSDLSDAVEHLRSRVEEDVTHLQDVINSLGGELATALANDAADAATIAEKQVMIDDARADAQTAVDNLNAIDPVADFPAPAPAPVPDPVPAPVEPPAEPVV